MEVSRKKFLQGVAGCAAGLALAGTVSAVNGRRNPAYAAGSAGEDFKGNPNRVAMLTDTTLCIGCRICEQACAQANGLPVPDIGDRAVFNALRRTHADAYTVVNRYQPADGGTPIFRKQQCMHCEEAACASACAVAALKKTPEGPVIYNPDVCIGCRYCMNACPFSMPTFEWNNPKPFIKKCIMCYQNAVSQGKTPACASACPPKATIFGKRSELLVVAHQRINESPGKYVKQVYGETEAGGTGWLYISSVSFDQLGLPANLGTTPFPEYTRDWLLGVPIVLMLWPALLMGVNSLVKHKEKQAVEEAPAAKNGGELK